MNEMDLNQSFRLKLTAELENRGMEPKQANFLAQWLPQCIIDIAIDNYQSISDFINETWGGRI